MNEIGELSEDLQVKPLRVLLEGEFERLDGTTTIKVDVRVVAATNRNLHELARDGKFRSDLFSGSIHSPSTFHLSGNAGRTLNHSPIFLHKWFVRS